MKKSKYKVNVQQVWSEDYTVKAESMRKAMKLAFEKHRLKTKERNYVIHCEKIE